MQKTLKGYPLHSDVDLDEIAEKTANFSGADLRELCRYAALYRLKEYLEEHGEFHTQNSQVKTVMTLIDSPATGDFGDNATLSLSDELLSSLQEEIDNRYNKPDLRAITMGDLLRALSHSRLNAEQSSGSFPKNMYT